jgi:hypothetical protein
MFLRRGTSIFSLNFEFNNWCWRNVVDSKASFWVHSESEIVFVYEVIYVYIYVCVCVYVYSHSVKLHALEL